MAVKLNYKILGKGDPVVILHGMFGSISNWKPIVKKLVEQYQVISVDLRNHGDSEHADSMTYPDMVDDLYELLKSLKLFPVNLIGHSMGGKTAMGFALTHPALTSKLIIVDIAPVNYSSSFHNYTTAMQDIPVTAINNRNEAEKYLARTIPEPMIRQFLLQNLVRKDNGYAWRINLDVINNHLETLSGFPEKWPYERFTGPACFLAGEQSDYIEPEHVNVITDMFPEAHLHVIEQAGHWIHAEKPEEVTVTVTTFLQR